MCRGRTLFKQDPFEQRVLVAKHQALVRCRSMALLQSGQRFFIVLDRRLELFDVFGATLTKSCLRLSIPLLALFRCRVDLQP